MNHYYMGLDFGTSGARAIVIDTMGEIQAAAQWGFDLKPDATDVASLWQTALLDLLECIPLSVRSGIQRIAIDGTSSTVLFCDESGTPLDAPLLYHDARGIEVLETLRARVPPNHPVLSATSSLAKLIWWLQTEKGRQGGRNRYLLHQADWLGFLLHGKLGVSDYHNALKLGYDVVNLRYPDWLTQGITELSATHPVILPQVLVPGTLVGDIKPEIADRFGLSRHCGICAGTTDSIAAFLASGAAVPGEAVTSLGSTLVLKLLSQTRVEDGSAGIYSHRLGNLWLAGGASNTGGAVLRQFFTEAELTTLSLQIDPQNVSFLDYYPLLKPGDRFPINDPKLPPKLEPRPASDIEFLQGLLESIAKIEAHGYRRLQELGATPLSRVYSAGGGAKNSTWTQIRERYLQVSMVPPIQTDAAYGAALLAMRSLAPITRKGF